MSGRPDHNRMDGGMDRGIDGGIDGGVGLLPYGVVCSEMGEHIPVFVICIVRS